MKQTARFKLDDDCCGLRTHIFLHFFAVLKKWKKSVNLLKSLCLNILEKKCKAYICF